MGKTGPSVAATGKEPKKEISTVLPNQNTFLMQWLPVILCVNFAWNRAHFGESIPLLALYGTYGSCLFGRPSFSRDAVYAYFMAPLHSPIPPHATFFPFTIASPLSRHIT